VVTKLRVIYDTGTTPRADLIRLIGVPGIKDDDRPLGTTNLRDKTMDPIRTRMMLSTPHTSESCRRPPSFHRGQANGHWRARSVERVGPRSVERAGPGSAGWVGRRSAGSATARGSRSGGQPPAKGGRASTCAPGARGVLGSARSPFSKKVQIDSTRASSGRSAETVLTSSRIETASAVAEDSPAAERAAAKYLMVTSGMWSDASLIG
jgi:hypothetical protein